MDMERDMGGRGRAVALSVLVASAAVGCGSGAFDGPLAESVGQATSTPDDDGNGGSGGDGSGAGGSGGGGSGGDGSGAGGSGGGGSGGGGAGGGNSGEGVEFLFELPSGPQSPSTEEDVLYYRIRESCEAGQSHLNKTWASLQRPRNVLLYQAAIDLCNGDRGSAAAVMSRVPTDEWSFSHSSAELDCST